MNITMQNDKIKIDIVSDVACPWCYVGKKRLEKAIAQWKGAPIDIEWHPFQLDANMPKEGLDRDTYLINKFGNLEGPLEMTKRLVENGKEEGITFNFGPEWRAVNTLPLHQLLHVAGEEGFKDVLKERLMKAYFDENLHLNKPEVLTTIMEEYGWPEEKTQEILKNEDIAYSVKQEIAHYQQRGVNSVPFFIINDKYGISGAQPATAFLEAFEQVAPLTILSEGDHCDSTTGIC
ncbi:DsbA family oxidoreductase [Maribacter confluentis]|uniref:DsbA family oxidoreductase n=1 Tax=Maribacter confluentis TaxID=1656093 RepID=A0ABT8RQ97_9FLAO|nr:DsbA family oxidoreductase [Maribacter confluentis]MDO1512667.1 DsbA family oxidoreductase [Maribacter confluentis]